MGLVGICWLSGLTLTFESDRVEASLKRGRCSRINAWTGRYKAEFVVTSPTYTFQSLQLGPSSSSLSNAC